MTALTIDAPLELRQLWSRWRFPLIVALLFLGFAVVLAAIENAPPSRPLDPADPSSQGGRALAQLLRDRGVDVHPVDAVGGAPLPQGSAVFVPAPASLPTSDLGYLARQGAPLVIVEPGTRELRALGLSAVRPQHAGETTLAAGCEFGPAAAAGQVRLQGTTYADTDGSATAACYGRGSSSALLAVGSGTSQTVIFGSARTFSNDWLDEEGDAALGLGLLSTSPRVVWVVPRPPTQAPADTRHRSLFELLPDRLLWAVLQACLALVLFALWRARRLGPVVAEPLPVVVRATETVEGRARLLRVARARGTAADSLRAAALERMRDRLGLAPDVARPAAVEALARRSGWNGADVDRVLYGPPPADDPALLRLSSELDQLDRAVRRG